MVGGSVKGSPISPTLFTVYMSSMVWKAEGRLERKEPEGARKTQHDLETTGTTRAGGGGAEAYLPAVICGWPRVGKNGERKHDG